MNSRASDYPLSAFEQEVRRIAESPERFHYPRRPFTARGSFIRRCAGCRMPKDFCICRYRTETESKAEFWVLMHIEEVNKPTNTARLIGDTLPSTRVFPWQRMKPPQEFVELLKDERYQPFIIFPDDQPDYQHRVVQNYPTAREGYKEKTPAFILLDGTWRQARKMFRQSDYLQDLSVLPVRASRKTQYQLRKPASDQHLCTAEVGIELLHLAGDQEAAEVLENYFAVFNQGYAAARRQKQADLSEAMQWLLNYQAGRNKKMMLGTRITGESQQLVLGLKF